LTFTRCHVERGETSLTISAGVRNHDYWVYWRRSRKIALIAQTNLSWLDLSADWEQQPKFYGRPWETAEMI